MLLLNRDVSPWPWHEAGVLAFWVITVKYLASVAARDQGQCPGWKGLCPGCAPADEGEEGDDPHIVG